MSGRRWPSRARAAARSRRHARRNSPPPPCVCGHPRDWHEHLRAGSDCGSCGTQVCARYTPGDPLELTAEVLDQQPWSPPT